MAHTLRDLVIQTVSTFFHERGMEPAIKYKEGLLEVNKPLNMSDENFYSILNEMIEHIHFRVKEYNKG